MEPTRRFLAGSVAPNKVCGTSGFGKGRRQLRSGVTCASRCRQGRIHTCATIATGRPCRWLLAAGVHDRSGAGAIHLPVGTNPEWSRAFGIKEGMWTGRNTRRLRVRRLPSSLSGEWSHARAPVNIGDQACRLRSLLQRSSSRRECAGHECLRLVFVMDDTSCKTCEACGACVHRHDPDRGRRTTCESFFDPVGGRNA